MWRRPFPRGGCSALGVGGGRGAPPCCVLPGVPLFRGQGPTREAARCGFSLSRGRGRSRRRWTRRAAVCPLLSRPASGVSPEKLPPPKATEVQSCGFFSVLAHLTSGVRFRGGSGEREVGVRVRPSARGRPRWRDSSVLVEWLGVVFKRRSSKSRGLFTDARSHPWICGSPSSARCLPHLSDDHSFGVRVEIRDLSPALCPLSRSLGGSRSLAFPVNSQRLGEYVCSAGLFLLEVEPVSRPPPLRTGGDSCRCQHCPHTCARRRGSTRGFTQEIRLGRLVSES